VVIQQRPGDRLQAAILVVDSDASFLGLAGTLLNKTRKVFLARDARQAFELATDLGFSVALVDLDLKGKDGLSLIEEMRTHFPDLPIIAISSAMEELESAREAGAVEVLMKPITPNWKPVVERIRAQNAR
jgi:CheY-like chemotaxis protein